MTTRYPAAYLRRSAADNGNPGEVSRSAQEAACRGLAERDGVTDLRFFEDWNRSADEAKEEKRAAFRSLMAAIERDEISCVYAAAQDRLYRSMTTYLRLIKTAGDHGTRIITARENRNLIDDSPMGKAWGQMAATFTELELNTIKARNATSRKVRKDRGDKMAAPYGKKLAKIDGRVVLVDDPSRPVAPLLAAYARAGTVQGACRLLDADGIVRPRNGGVWQPASLTAILGRVGGVLPARKHRTHYSHASLLASLIRCPCGRTMTPDRTKGGYYCANGARQGFEVHGKYYASEARLMPLVREEMAHLDVPDAYSVAESHEAERTALLERRRRLAVLYADTLIDDEGYRAELAAITKALDDLGDASYIVDVPGIDWDDDVAKVNEALRALLARIELDVDMRPKPDGFVWRVPSMRSA